VTSMVSMSQFPTPTLDSLRGLWTRSLIEWPDGRRDTDTQVRWLQGPSLYIDLRQPAHRPDFSGARGFEDLNDAHLKWLARQEGFAGRLGFDGTFFEWSRTIDLQPIALYSDAGRLWLEPGRMVEQGRDITYIEHWHCEADASAARCFAARLCRREDGCEAFLVRAEGHFMFAKARPSPLPQAESLLECLSLATSPEQRYAWLDCEISYGRAARREFEIRHSSLPWRERLCGEMRTANGSLRLVEAGSPSSSEWQIIEAEGDITLLAA